MRNEDRLAPSKVHKSVEDSKHFHLVPSPVPVPRLQLSRVDFTTRPKPKVNSEEAETNDVHSKQYVRKPHRQGHQSGKSDLSLIQNKSGLRSTHKSSLPTLGESSLRPIMLIPTGPDSPEGSMTWEQKIKARKHQQKQDTARQRRTDQLEKYKSLTERGDDPAVKLPSVEFPHVEEVNKPRGNSGAYDILELANSELRKKGGGNWDRKQLAKAFQVKDSQYEFLLYNGKVQQRDSIWASRKSKLHRKSQLSTDGGKRSMSQTQYNTERGEQSTTAAEGSVGVPTNNSKQILAEKISQVYKLDIDASYWLGEAEFGRLIGMLRQPLTLETDNSAAGMKQGSLLAEEGWHSILNLLQTLSSYLTKLLSETYSEEEARPHRSIQQLILEEIKKRAVELKSFTDSRGKFVFLEQENQEQTTKTPATDTASDLRKVVKELTDWFKHAREKYGIELENPEILPKEHPNAEKLTFEMEKIKSFLFVKSQTELMNNVDRLEKVLNRVTNCAISLAHEADQLRRHNEMLEGVVYRLKEEIGVKVVALKESYDKIEIVKPPDRLKIMLDIEEELSALKNGHSEEIKDLFSKIDTLEQTVRTKQKQITDLEYKLTNKNSQENKAVQVTLDTEDKSKTALHDMQSYFDNINYFILGGKQQSQEWATVLITDILNSKLQADRVDIEAQRDVTSLRTYTFQYFMKQFGCRRAGLALLKDFFYTLSQLYQDSMRFESFLNLTGCNCLRLKQNTDMQEYLRKNRVVSSFIFRSSSKCTPSPR